jgi:hypothetical protein
LPHNTERRPTRNKSRVARQTLDECISKLGRSRYSKSTFLEHQILNAEGIADTIPLHLLGRFRNGNRFQPAREHSENKTSSGSRASSLRD